MNEVPELLGLSARPVLVVVGGASGMPDESPGLSTLFDDVLAPLVEKAGATVVDGGTDEGVMRLMGAAREAGRTRSHSSASSWRSWRPTAIG